MDLAPDILHTHFRGYAGQTALSDAVQLACTFAAAQCPAWEIVAGLERAHPEWPEDLAVAVCEYAAPVLQVAKDAAKAGVRVEILGLLSKDKICSARVALLKEFAYQHLDWTREPIDAEIKRALRKAETEAAKGNLQ